MFSTASPAPASWRSTPTRYSWPSVAAPSGDRQQLQFVDADLRADWVSALPSPGPYDAAVSTTALHWLGLEQLIHLYQALARVLRPGAVFLDGDRLDFDHDQRTIAAGARQVRPEWPDAPEGAEDYDAWWEAAVADPALAREVAEREQRWHTHPHEDEAHSYEFHRSALFSAGLRRGGHALAAPRQSGAHRRSLGKRGRGVVIAVPCGHLWG